MTTQEAREHFNRMAEEATKQGNPDAAAKIEIAREYFTNPEFRTALQQLVWDINQKEGR